MMAAKLIKTQREYRSALRRVEQLMDARRGTPQGDELKLLAALIEIYEEKHAPVPPPEPVEAIRFCKEQKRLSQQTPRPSIHDAFGKAKQQRTAEDLDAQLEEERAA